MAVEQKRGCGFRKVGGLYLVGGGMAGGCHRLPLNIHVCPVCSSGLKYSRGFTWFKPAEFFGPCKLDMRESHICHGRGCAVCFPPKGKHGLMWIGKSFYSARDFVLEAEKFGISRRIAALPREFVLGETWVYLAHLKGGTEPDASGETLELLNVPAVFYCFKPIAVEKIVTETQSQDAEEMAGLEKRGITPVIVPDGDADHVGSVHEKIEME